MARTNPPTLKLLCVLALAGIACGDDDGTTGPDMDAGMVFDGGPSFDGGPGFDGGPTADAGPGTDGGPDVFDTVEERLDHLRVPQYDLDSPEVGGTALRDFNGDAVPDEAHPLRTPVATLTGADEFYVTGTGNGGGAVVDFDRPSTPGLSRFVVAQPAGGLEVALDPAVVALHLDDDGREEVLVFDARAPSPGATNEVYVFAVEDEEAAYATSSVVGESVGTWPGATNLRAVRADTDGDGLDEVLLAAIVGDDVEHRGYDPRTKTLFPAVRMVRLRAITHPVYGISLAAGQSDDDPGDEVAIGINYREPRGVDGTTRVAVLGTFIDREIIMEDGRKLVGGAVTMADVDADFRDEIVVAGSAPGDTAGSYEYRLLIRDDVTAGITRLFEDTFTGSLSNTNSVVRVRQTQLAVANTSVSSVTPELPGAEPPSGFQAFDPAEDVLVNNVIWEFSPVDLPPEGVTPEERIAAMARPASEVFRFGRETDLIIDDETVQFALGQLNADGLPDAGVLSEIADLFELTDQEHTLAITGLLSGTTQSVVLAPDGRVPMQMVQANMDSDSIVVRHLREEHVMRYSEPVILAVLAATPCYPGPDGQYTNECSTNYGNAVSASTAQSSTYGFSMGLTVGYGWEDRVATQSELKAKATLTARTAFGTGSSTEITFSKAYFNGTQQDQVLATVFGLEQFTYEILSAPPGMSGESRVGQTITISVPRSDVQTTRLFSESLIRPSLRPSQAAALDAVFHHTPGDPSTYLRRHEIADYVAGLGVTGPECNESTSPDALADCGYLTSRDGADPGVVSVAGGVRGSGTGIDGNIMIENSMDETRAWGMEAMFDLELSLGGAIFGMQLGASTDNSITVSHGNSIEYGFRMGAVDPAVYAPYQAQLVTFHHRFDCNANDECQSFEVLNFWAEPSVP